MALATLFGGGLKFLTGFAQGGGFGVGYGFGVRLGYDLYGQIKQSLGLDTPEKANASLAQSRYSLNTSVSHFGSGGIMGLKQAFQ